MAALLFQTGGLSVSALDCAFGFAGRLGGGVARLVERGFGGAGDFLAGAGFAALSLASAAGFRRGLAAGLSAADFAVELLRGARRAGGLGAAAGGVSSLSAKVSSPYCMNGERNAATR